MSSGTICVLAFGLLVLAAFGHALWVIGAAFLGFLFGTPRDGARREPPDQRPYGHCPACGADLETFDRHCRECDLLLDSRLARDLHRVRVAEREVRALVDRVQLDRDEAAPVLDQLEARARSLRGFPPKSAPRPRATPLSPPPVSEPVEPTAFAPSDAAGAKPEAAPDPLPAPAVAALAEVEPPGALPPPVPARPLSPEPIAPKRRSSFLEEHNILWGELVGGLLIVGCSVALLVTLWRQLEEIRYFPFALSAGVTLALFGAGQYTLHRWKLAGTSRGMLVISMLLTPITLLLLSEPVAHGTGGVFDVAIKLTAVVGFVGIVRTGGRDLIGTEHLPSPIDRRWLLSLAVVGAAGTQLLPAVASTPWLPLLCFVVAVGATLGGLSWYHPERRDRPISDPSRTALIMFVGLAVFALFAGWGMFLVRPPADVVARLHELAVPLVLVAVPVVEAGVLVLRRASSAGLRTTGTAVALLGFLGTTVSLALGWPDPFALLVVSVAAGAFLTHVAFRERLTWVQIGAVPLLAFAAVIGFHGIAGNWVSPIEADAPERLAGLLDSSASGAALVGCALALAGLAERLARRASHHTFAYAVGALIVGSFGLLLVSSHGTDRPTTAAVAHAAAALGLLATNVRYTRRASAHGGLWLLLAATLWALWATVPRMPERWGFVIAVEALLFAAGAVALRGTHGPATALLRRAARDVSFGACILAVVLATGSFTFRSDWHSYTLFALAFTGVSLARLTGWAPLTWAGSVAALLGCAHLALHTLEGEPTVLALETATLAHATLATLAAIACRRQGRVFGDPFRYAARLSSVLAIPLLFFAPLGYSFVAAPLALWLGAVWLCFALLWRERGAFSAFQAAVSLAALLVAFGWVEQQPWWGTTSLQLRDPRVLHAFGFALAALSVGWAVARRALAPLPRARALWCDNPLSFDRLALAGTVGGFLLLAAVAVEPAARAELTWTKRAAPAELARAFDAPAWWLLAALTAAVVLSWRLSRFEFDGGPHAVGLAVLALAAPTVWAGTHAVDVAAASALRWGLALAFVGGSVAIALRAPLRRALAAAGFPTHPEPWLRPTLLALVAVSAGVVLVLSGQVAELGLNRLTPRGPAEGSIFVLMGAIASNLVPLAFVVTGLALTAGRERSGGYALSGGLVFVVTLTAGYALAVVVAGKPLDGTEQTRLYLVAAASAAAWALAWLAWLASERRVPGGAPLAVQVSLGLGALGLLCALTAARVIARPEDPLSAATDPLGQYGWAALALVAGAGFWHTRRHAHDLQPLVFGFAALAVGVLVAAALREEDGPEFWLSFHALAVTWAAGGFALLALPRSRIADGVLTVFAALLVLCATRSGWHDPLKPWLPAALSLCAAVLFGAVALRRQLGGFAILSGAAVNLAAVFVWLARGPDTNSGFLLANAAGIGAAVACWALVRIRSGARGWLESLDLAPLFALVLLGIGLAPTFAADRVNPAALTWGATVAVALGCAVGLWDRAARFARQWVYAAGVLAVLLAAAQSDARPVWAAPLSPLALAGFALCACGSAFALSRRASPLLGMPERGDGWPWLVSATAAVGALSLVFGLHVGLESPDVLERLAFPVGVALLALAPAVLLRICPDAFREPLQTASVALGVVALTALAWALPDPAARFVWLERNAWLFVALTAAAVAGSEGAARLGTDWLAPRKRVAGWAAALALAVLCVNFLQQIPTFDPVERRTPLSREAALAMLAAIAALFVLALRFALKPERDPLALPEHRRTGYVYLAEVLIVLFFTQIRFNVPELFLGDVAKLWTFTVMALAYAGIGLAELFERKKSTVLAVPLRRTGVLLPLVPLIAFWAKPPQFISEFAQTSVPGLGPLLGYLQKLPQHFDTYAWLWFLAGGVYGLLALKKKSFGWALLAALATNAAMWSLLAHHQISFAVHPQAWVIPLALIVLVSEHINRSRLSAEASNAMRYAGVAMIYVASAADLFIAGVGSSVWLPVVLAVLCVAGVCAGIALRVRAFIYLGVAFLLLDVFAMIWHAAVNLEQTWVWYASGIVLGVLVLGLFAYLEKRRANADREERAPD